MAASEYKQAEKKRQDKPEDVGSSTWTNAKDAVDEWYGIVTNERIWWQQPLVEKATIDGVMYQEAYAGRWVSYDAAARKKALTGYQFRAPAEWFAELYAGYKSNKLGPKHPAREWLKKL